MENMKYFFSIISLIPSLTLCWVIWGVITPGDSFANGSKFFWPSILVVAGASLIISFTFTSKGARIFISLAVIASFGFWLFVPSGWWASAPPKLRRTVEKSEYLEATIANCKIIEPNVIIFDFELKNNSKQSLNLYERWNSWGAYQWTINVEDANGDVWDFSNPQGEWPKNFPSTFEIAPWAKYVIKCVLYGGPAAPPVDRYLFTSSTKKGMNHLPLIITGRFTSEIDKSDSWKEISPNWEGAITTENVIVK